MPDKYEQDSDSLNAVGGLNVKAIPPPRHRLFRFAAFRDLASPIQGYFIFQKENAARMTNNIIIWTISENDYRLLFDTAGFP